MFVQEIFDGNDHPVARLAQTVLDLPEDLRHAALERFVMHEDADTRARSLAIAERLAHPDIHTFCLRLLVDPVWYVRVRACECAERNHVIGAVEIIINMISHDDNEDVRATAASSIGTLAPMRFLAQLEEIAQSVTGNNHEGTPVRDLLLLSLDHVRSRRDS